jgi:FHS family glucose/mannose:H+ symporter-like MFS transporter
MNRHMPPPLRPSRRRDASGPRSDATGTETAPSPHPRGRRALFAAACAGIFVFGIVLALLGTLFGLPGVRARYGVDLAGQGDLFLLLFLGILSSTVVVGPLMDRFGKKAILVWSSVLVAAALAGFAIAEGFAEAAMAALVLGVGGGGLNTTNNVLVSDLYGAERASRLNILGVSFGVGALGVPLAAASLSAWIGITTLLLVSAGLAAASALLYAALRFPPAHEVEGFSLARAARVVHYPGMMYFAAIFFCQSGNESSIGGWTSTYVNDRGWSPQVATWVLTVYWGALLAGRLAAARYLAHADKARVLFACGAGSAAGSLVLLMGTALWHMTAGVAVLGLSFAPVYPTGIAMAGDRYARYTGTVFGTLFSIGLAGGTVFPWVIGRVGQVAGVRPGMLLPLAGALLICGLVTQLARRHPQPE